jgi:CheY-like chemotaxis protein
MFTVNLVKAASLPCFCDIVHDFHLHKNCTPGFESVAKMEMNPTQYVAGMYNNIPFKILLVDDEEDLSMLIVNWLVEESYVVECAYNGLEALEKINATEYDLLILDITLPVFDGMEICSIVRKYRPKLPILIVTAHHSSTLKKISFDKGANAFMNKPFKLSALSNCVRDLLSTDRHVPSNIQHSLI